MRVSPGTVVILMGGILFAHITTASDFAADRAAVWLADVPGGDPVWAQELAGQVRAAGYAVETLDSITLTNVTQIDTNSFALLVLPNARILPVESVAAITHFLGQGGHLMALGLTAWETPTFRLGDRWLTQAAYQAGLAAQPVEHRLVDFAAENATNWVRHSNQPGHPATREIVPSLNGAALRVRLDSLDGWDTVEPPARSWVWEPEQSLTCFRARGNTATRQLALEWTEADGSRWIATVDLKPEWQNFALPPSAFRPWQPPPARGGPGDQVNLRHVARFTVGLAVSHTAFDPGPLEYEFADFGTARNPFGDAPLPASVALPRLESLSPAYQCFALTTPVSVRPPPWQALVRETASTTHNGGVRWSSDGRALHPRPRGVGWRQKGSGRWQPILVARDADTDEYRGAVGVLLAPDDAPGSLGTWAVFTPADAAFYRQAPVHDWLGRTLRRLRAGAFLTEGGAEYFTLFPDQPVQLGARIRNFRPDRELQAEVMLTVLPQREGPELLRHRAPVTVAPGATEVVETLWNPAAWPTGGCVVAVQLLVNGRLVDELYHELNRWEPKRNPEFVSIADGGFQLGGKSWRAHGVNYLPSSGIGVANEHFEYWLGRGAYDPEVIERDLRRIQAMGLNAVSAFIYHRDLASQHLLDFLFRCERLGLKVNLSLRPGTPMEFRWDEMKALIEHYRLPEWDTVMAYDLAWEPSHFDEAFQWRNYGGPWNDWLRRRHGTVAAAVRDWACPSNVAAELTGPPASVETNVLLTPPARWLVQDGPWRPVVVEYREFLDEWIGQHYAEARRRVRTVDPHHPFSFRMQLSGDPTHTGTGLIPYDFFGLRDAVDIWEPEAYGRIGTWDKVRPGLFTVAFARLCDPAKPVVWAEMGTSVWDGNANGASPSKLAFAASFYRDFYRMLRESASDGVFFWWYPGGFRLFENSDYGILNPDGTDREVTRVIRAEGPRFLAASPRQAPTRWVPVQPGPAVRGLPGIYEAVQADFWQAVATGEPVGLQWAAPAPTGRPK